MTQKQTQKERILTALIRGKTFSVKQAQQYGIKNLRARVDELRNDNWNIQLCQNSNGVNAYRLV